MPAQCNQSYKDQKPTSILEGLYNFTTEVSQSSTFSKTVYNFQILSWFYRASVITRFESPGYCALLTPSYQTREWKFHFSVFSESLGMWDHILVYKVCFVPSMLSKVHPVDRNQVWSNIRELLSKRIFNRNGIPALGWSTFCVFLKITSSFQHELNLKWPKLSSVVYDVNSGWGHWQPTKKSTHHYQTEKVCAAFFFLWLKTCQSRTSGQ